MDVLRILEQLRRQFSFDDENDEAVISEDDGGGLGLEGRRGEVKDKFDMLSGLIEIIGPVARKEAILANAFRVVKSAWKWIIFEEEAEAEQKLDFPEFYPNDAMLSLFAIRESLLRVVNSLSPGFYEVLDIEVVAELITTFLYPAKGSSQEDEGDEISESMKVEALKAVKNICKHSERNREFLANLRRRDVDLTNSETDDEEDDSFAAFFCAMVRDEKVSPIIVRYWCEALAAFILNDDRRVVPNRAEERKKLITKNGGLESLLGFLTKYRDPPQLNAIVISLTLMSSTREQCDLILEGNAFGPGSGLELVLQNYTSPERDRLVLNVISCVKNLTISPAFQHVLEKSFLVKNILAAGRRMKETFSHVEIIMSALATISIRSPAAVAQFLKSDGLEIIFDLMNFHKENSSVVKSFCLILENVVAYGGDFGKNSVIENEGEALLKDLIKSNPELIDTFLKPTLRQLGVRDSAINTSTL